MYAHDLSALYRRYIDCLNRRDWVSLGEFVAQDVLLTTMNCPLFLTSAITFADCRHETPKA